MEPIITGSLPGFEAYPNPRDGFEMTFSGNALDAAGEPEGERVEVKLIVPPLDFHSLQKIQSNKKARAEPDVQADVLDTICLALKRNYRGVPRWLVEQSLDGPLLMKLNAKMREMQGVTEEKKATETTT